MKVFDLTTKSGKTDAISSMGLFPSLFLTSSPIWLLKIALDKLSSSKDQGEIAAELIRKGKENNVKEMEIIVDNKKGLNLRTPIEGVDVKVMVGSDEKANVKVVYK
ncbi:MAG: hypothetical protein PUB61_02255 [Bacteroidales bacterium]|nr:hypothetical protein [Bacteroidales bacterium]